MPLEIIHEHRAMRFTFDDSGIFINGVNFMRLVHVEDKKETSLVAFTDEERNDKNFNKFYKRFDDKDDE